MAEHRLYQILRDRIRALFDANETPTPTQIAEVERAARAQFAGEASGISRRAVPPADAPADAAPLPAPALAAAPPMGGMTDCPYCTGASMDPNDCTCTADCGMQGCPKGPTAGQTPMRKTVTPVPSLGISLPAGAIRLAELTTDQRNALPDSAYACVDASGRHYPHHNPDGSLDTAHLVNALGRVAQDATTSCGARHLQAHATQAGIGLTAAVDAAVRLAAIREEVEDDGLAAVYTSLRLDDGAGSIPAWQVFHVVGSHGNHPKFGAIDFTREMGDQIIRNHAAGVLGRDVPLDFRHATALDGEAGGYVDRFAWGRKGDGLPGRSEPAGQGDILYAHFPAYNDVGLRALTQEHYRHQSPEYDRNYQGHGAVALALAATNNPFLRGLRTLQGREHVPVLLDAGTEEETSMPPETTPPATTTTPPPATPTALTQTPAAAAASLEETVRQLQADLALERSARSATETRLSNVEHVRHEDNVTSAVERAILSGTPPALARKVGRIMLGLRPDEQGAIRLSDDAAASPVNTYAAMASLLEDLPRIRLGSVTTGLGDERPLNGAPEAVSLEDQAYEAVKARQLAAFGIQAPSTNGNGTH